MTEGAVLTDGVLLASTNSRLPCRREFFRVCAQQRTCVYAVKVRCPPEQGKDE